MQRSESIKELAAALAKAQGQIKGAIKDSANPFYHSKYADLASCWDVCRTPLSDNGLAVIQMPKSAEEWVEVETLLVHSSGEWVSETFRLPASQMGKDGKERFDAQTVGTAITYARRYTLMACVGIAPEDDDGNAARAAAPPRMAQEDVRGKGLAILQPASQEGMESLERAWKSISPAMRTACQNDLPGLKEKASAAVTV